MLRTFLCLSTLNLHILCDISSVAFCPFLCELHLYVCRFGSCKAAQSGKLRVSFDLERPGYITLCSAKVSCAWSLSVKLAV